MTWTRAARCSGGDDGRNCLSKDLVRCIRWRIPYHNLRLHHGLAQRAVLVAVMECNSKRKPGLYRARRAGDGALEYR